MPLSTSASTMLSVSVLLFCAVLLVFLRDIDLVVAGVVVVALEFAEVTHFDPFGAN